MFRGIFGKISYVLASPIIFLVWLVESILKKMSRKEDESPYIAGIQISKNGTSSVVDVGAYFGSIPELQRRKFVSECEELEKVRKEAVDKERAKKMRAGRINSLTITLDGASIGIKTREDLVRYFQNIPEEELRKIIDFNRDAKKE